MQSTRHGCFYMLRLKYTSENISAINRLIFVILLWNILMSCLTLNLYRSPLLLVCLHDSSTLHLNETLYFNTWCGRHMAFHWRVPHCPARLTPNHPKALEQKPSASSPHLARVRAEKSKSTAHNEHPTSTHTTIPQRTCWQSTCSIPLPFIP